MREVGCVSGEVGGGKAFGNWLLRPEDGREFAERGIVPYHAPRTSAGKDWSDPAILLEVYGWIRDREDCDTVILGSGDADYRVVVDRVSRVNYICRLASISFAGSPPWPGPVAGLRWCGSWGRQTPG